MIDWKTPGNRLAAKKLTWGTLAVEGYTGALGDMERELGEGAAAEAARLAGREQA
jgi:hypothetical protein